jgi:acylphosphatase
VGFRYTVVTIARRYDVTGFVQNLSDGRVKLVVEGPISQVRGLLEDVAAAMEEYIAATTIEEQPPSGQFTAFEVRY